MYEVFFTRWASRHQPDGRGGGLTETEVVDVYFCGLSTNSRHQVSVLLVRVHACAGRQKPASHARAGRRGTSRSPGASPSPFLPSLVARALALRAPALGKAWPCARGRRQTALATALLAQRVEPRLPAEGAFSPRVARRLASRHRPTAPAFRFFRAGTGFLPARRRGRSVPRPRSTPALAFRFFRSQASLPPSLSRGAGGVRSSSKIL